MNYIEVNGIRFRISLTGPEEAPVVVLSNSLGTSLDMWEDQVLGLSSKYRVLTYDSRGHGETGVPDGPYSIQMLAHDVIGILDALAIKKAHWCGLSIGGIIGQWLAANMPDRLERVVLANTTAYYADPSFWHERISAVRQGGLEAISDRIVDGWLSPRYRQDNPDIVKRLKTMLLTTSDNGYIATCEALASFDNRACLPLIKKPTLVIAGLQDKSIPVAACKFIADRVSGAKFEVVDAAHISNVEQPDAFLSTIVKFLDDK